MKQKLGIAAAYMENPDIIILDEPINALDEAGAKQVYEILEEQKKSRSTYNNCLSMIRKNLKCCLMR